MPPKISSLITSSSSSRTNNNTNKVPYWQTATQRPAVPQRNAVGPNFHFGSSPFNSNPNSRNNSPRTSLSSNNNNNNNYINNPPSRKGSTQLIYTTKDLDEKNAQFLALREKRLNQILPLVRQRQNELLDMCTATAEIVNNKQLEYHEKEQKDDDLVEIERRTLSDIRRAIEEKKKQVDDAGRRKMAADEKLEAAEQHKKKIEDESLAVGHEISLINREIDEVCARKDHANRKTEEKLKEREEQEKGVDALRQEYDDVVNEKRAADRVYDEKMEVLADLKKKIAALKAERAKMFKGR